MTEITDEMLQAGRDAIDAYSDRPIPHMMLNQMALAAYQAMRALEPNPLVGENQVERAFREFDASQATRRVILREQEGWKR